MIMKRKNILLSIFLSITILAFSSCSTDDISTTTVISSNVTTTTSDTEAAETTTTVSSEETTETTTLEVTTTKASDIEQTTSTKADTEIKTEDTAMTTMEETVEKKYIALSFDDGPNTTTTNDVLDVLEQYGIKASFFLIGNNINSETEVVVKRAYDMGCDIENHSKSHPYMNEMSIDEIKEEVSFVNDYIKKITGETPTFFRPPYIAINNTMYDNIDQVFIAGFGCNDWDPAIPADRRAQVILRQAQDGGIILLHDAQGNDQTVEALHTIIPELQAQGYEFVTMTELFEIKGVSINPDDKNLYTFVN